MKIEIRDLTKLIRGNTVLDHINLDIALQGEGVIYGIQGVNGSGKTMLMRAICGLIVPTEGYVRIDGQEIGKEISFPPSVGLLLENPVFVDEFTGFKNLELLCGIKGAASSAQIREALVRVGLSPEDRRNYRKYSLGMKQRLGIAAAIVEDPDLVLLDEPFNALDEEGVQMVQEILADLKKRGKLIIMACHDRDLMETQADVILKMKNGKIV